MQEPSLRIIVLDDIGLRFTVNRLRFVSRRGSQAAVVSEPLAMANRLQDNKWAVLLFCRFTKIAMYIAFYFIIYFCEKI